MAHPRERFDESMNATFSIAIGRLDGPGFALSENRAPSKASKYKALSYDDKSEQLDIITEGA